MRTLSLAIATLFALVFSVTVANAAAGTCGADVQANTAAIMVDYDPFSPTSFSQTATLSMHRNVGAGGGKTQNIAFYFKPTTGFPAPAGTQILHGANNVFAAATGPFPTLALHNASAGTVQSFAGSPGYMEVGYGGTGQPDTISFSLTFNLAAGWDVPAGTEIKLDMVYICKGTGGFDDVDSPTTAPTSVTIVVTVKSALQITYAGPALDFGEIGELDNTEALAESRTGFFNIRSTAPYSVDLSSANAFLLLYPLGPSTTPNVGTVKYGLSFLGNNLSNPTLSMTQKKCPRPPTGITSWHNLGITATLQEGGEGKTSAPNYSDMLTVTVAPLAVPAAGLAASCS